MSNRVKAGDLAIVVNAKRSPENNGKVVLVVRPATDYENTGIYRGSSCGVCWFVRTVGSPLAELLYGADQTRFVQERFFYEHCLKPIRDPGEDAIDEMVLIKPLPQKESV